MKTLKTSEVQSTVNSAPASVVKKRSRKSLSRFAFPIEGWDKADLSGFERSAPLEDGHRSLQELGFEKLCSVESYHRRPNRLGVLLDEFSLWKHSQGIIAIMDSTTGGWAKGKDWRSGEEYDPNLRQVNSISWDFQLEIGCGEVVLKGLGSVGGSGGAWVQESGSWAEERNCTMQGHRVNDILKAIQSSGRLIKLTDWKNYRGKSRLLLPSQLWLGVEGREIGGDEIRPERRTELFDSWRAKLLGEIGSELNLEGYFEVDSRVMPRINDVGPYLSRCIGKAGRRWPTGAESKLHTTWSHWISDVDGVEAIPQDGTETFQISECGATILQCLLSDIHNERSQRLALGFIHGAPLSRLTKVANAIDGRGVTAGMRCFEVCASSSKESAQGAQRVFDALASRLGPYLKMSSSTANAVGLLFSQGDRPHRGGYYLSSEVIDHLFISAEHHGTLWTVGGIRCPHPTPSKETGDSTFPWGIPRLSKSMPALAGYLNQLGCPAAAALAEAKALGGDIKIKKLSVRSRSMSL